MSKRSRRPSKWNVVSERRPRGGQDRRPPRSPPSDERRKPEPDAPPAGPVDDDRRTR